MCAQVDRCGKLVHCGPTPMEDAVISSGGRVPETVASASSASGVPFSQMVGPNNIISARYMEAASMHQVGPIFWSACSVCRARKKGNALLS